MSKLKNVLRMNDNWVQGTYKGHFFMAKVYSEGSIHGIAEGRTSKLIVCKGEVWNSDKIIFNYDRGMDVDHELGHEIAWLLESL